MPSGGNELPTDADHLRIKADILPDGGDDLSSVRDEVPCDGHVLPMYRHEMPADGDPLCAEGYGVPYRSDDLPGGGQPMCDKVDDLSSCLHAVPFDPNGMFGDRPGSDGLSDDPYADAVSNLRDGLPCGWRCSGDRLPCGFDQVPNGADRLSNDADDVSAAFDFVRQPANVVPFGDRQHDLCSAAEYNCDGEQGPIKGQRTVA